MGCDQCGDQTPNPKLCSKCQRLERAENDARHDRGETDAHECPSCGEDRALVEGKECWLCRSDRYQEDEDGRPELATDGGTVQETVDDSEVPDAYSPTSASITCLGESGPERPFAATLRASVDDDGVLYLVDRDGDDVFEFAFLLGNHPETEEWCPEVDELPDDVVDDLEAHASRSIDLEGEAA